MESSTWMENPGFLKKHLTNAVARLNKYFSSNLPDREVTENGDVRVAMLLLGFGTLLYSLQQQVPRSNRQAVRQDKAIKALTQIIKNGLPKTGYSNDIFVDILHSRTLGDVAYDRLISLFQLVGVVGEDRIASLLPSFLTWSRDEVEYFRIELPRDGKNESPALNRELDLPAMSAQKSPPKKPIKKLAKNKAEHISATAH